LEEEEEEEEEEGFWSTGLRVRKLKPQRRYCVM